MTIERAIKILQDNLQHNTFIRTPEDRNAIKLGIEALKRVSLRRILSAEQFHETLPGETKD